MAINASRCTRIAVIAAPPTIVVDYHCCSKSPISRNSNKSTVDERIRIDHRRKTIRLHNLAASSDSAEIVAYRLGRKFPRHLGPKVVNPAQLQGLVLKLQCLVNAGSATPCTRVSHTRSDAEKVAVEDQHQAQEEEEEEEEDNGDLNLASENELVAAKMRMNVVFEQNLLKPGSPGYVHDVRRDFDQAEEECDWDEDSS